MRPMTDNRRAAYARMKANGTYRRIGRQGGLATKAKQLQANPDYYRQIGHLSGRVTLQRYGRAFLRAIGGAKKGEVTGQPFLERRRKEGYDGS